MNGLKAKKKYPIANQPLLKNLFSGVLHLQFHNVLFFFIKEQEQTGRDWFKIVSKTTWLSCLVK